MDDQSLPLEVVMELLASDSEDEEADEVLYAAAAHLLRLDRNRIPMYFERVVGCYYNFEFKRLFRLSLETFEELACKFEASHYFPSPRGGRPQIPAQKTCLIGLTYLGTQTCMYKIADNFDVSESSVSLCLKRILDFLFSISGEVITWPCERQREVIKAKFLARSKGKGPRDTIGSVDGSHIEIKKPSESPASYYNRKKFFSLILQAICDADCRFTDVFVGFPGSAHDARVLKESTFFVDAAQKCSNDYILGDSAYPLLPWLMSPYKDNQATFQNYKEDFNKCHSLQRVAVENAFGMLKQRFRRLYFVDAETIDQSCRVILGACVLHNLCCNSRDDMDDFAALENDDECDDEQDGVISTNQPTREACEQRRKTIAQTQC